MSRMQRLVLFDVDLTLIATTGCNLLALNSAFEQLHGIPDAFNDVVFGGGLDLPLMTEMFRKWGLTKGNPNKLPDLSEFKAVYFDHLVRRLETWTDGFICPGARDLLEALAREPGVQMGLETGNFREAAFIKLRRFGLDTFFEEGGFGGDWITRTEVVADAIARCQAISGRVHDPGEIFLIGDSPSDVEAGKANGINTVAVATGRCDTDTIRALGPAFVFEDLSDTKKVLDALLGRAG